LNSFSSSIELVDVDQIEFVRGRRARSSAATPPAASSTSPAGRPSELAGGGGLDLNFGNYNLRDVRAVVSGPLSKDGAALECGGRLLQTRWLYSQ